MIVTGEVKDEILDFLVGLTITSVLEERPLFQNPLEEPYFYQTYFKRWVIEGLEERKKMDAKDEEIARRIQGVG